MKKSSKLVACVCAGLMMLSLVGCGGEQPQTKGAEKKVQIQYWHVAAESFGGATVKELVTDFNASHPNIEVVEKYNPDMYKGLTQNLQAAIAAGKSPDVVQMGWSYLNYAAENFKYTDISSVIAKDAPADKDFLQRIFCLMC